MAYASGSANLYTVPSRRGHHPGQRQGGDYRTAPGIRAPVRIDHDRRYGAFQTRADGQRQPHIANYEVRGNVPDQLAVLPDVASDDIRPERQEPPWRYFPRNARPAYCEAPPMVNGLYLGDNGRIAPGHKNGRRTGWCRANRRARGDGRNAPWSRLPRGRECVFEKCSPRKSRDGSQGAACL